MKKRVFSLLMKNMTARKLGIAAPPWEGKTYENVPYSNLSKAHTLDLYVPSSEKPPLLILVHGGGFFANDSKSRQSQFMYRYFRANGYACASVNYRLAQEARYPAAVEDVKAAVKFLRAHAAEYGYDGEKCAIWGESAGGYLAAMVALCGEDEFNGVPPLGAEGVSARLSAFVDFYGIAESEKVMSDFAEMGISKRLVKFVNGAYDPDRIHNAFFGKPSGGLSAEELAERSPLSRVSERLRGSGLHAYFAHGSADITVPKAQSERFYGALRAVLGEARVQYALLRDFKHADDRFYTPENLLPVKRFLDGIE